MNSNSFNFDKMLSFYRQVLVSKSLTFSWFLGRDFGALGIRRRTRDRIVSRSGGTLSVASQLLWNRSRPFGRSLSLNNNMFLVCWHWMDKIAVVVGECVRFFFVNSIVTNHALLICHAKGNAQHKLDEAHDCGCPEDVPANDEESTDNLQPNLLPIAINSAASWGNSEGIRTTLSGKYTGEETANDGSNEVSVENVKGIINALEECDMTLAQVERNLSEKLV
jgi:hypothetical protein